MKSGPNFAPALAPAPPALSTWWLVILVSHLNSR